MSLFDTLFDRETPEYREILLNYKTFKCKAPKCNNQSCRGSHSDFDSRRYLFDKYGGKLLYSEALCEKGDCNQKECPKSHNQFEVLFHVMNFKTKNCQNFVNCPVPRIICPYTHIGEKNRSEIIQPILNIKELYLPNSFTPEKEPKNLIDLDTYKVFPCQNKEAHTKGVCPFYHSRQDQRRSLQEVEYSAEECQFLLKCPIFDKCLFSHNTVEQFYHLTRYKTRFCSSYPNSKKCKFGDFCSFAHKEEELLLEFKLHKMPKNEDFFLYYFKTILCPFPYDHDKASCEYYHNPQDLRRSLQTYEYNAKECPKWVKYDINCYEDGKCDDLFGCLMCHGWKEYEFHFNVYKTKKCTDGTLCKKKICPYYHTLDEKRYPFPL